MGDYYQTRPSPSYPAKLSPGEVELGNDQTLWESKPIQRGWRWFRVPSTQTQSTSSRRRSPSPRRRSPRRSPRRRSPRRRNPSPRRRRSSNPRRNSNVTMIKPDSDLSEKQQKWCRCVLHVAAKQSPACLRSRAWRSKIKGKTCYNPYSVCAKSVGTTAPYCATQYQLSELSKKELLSLGYLEDLKVSSKNTRGQLIERIQSHLEKK